MNYKITKLNNIPKELQNIKSPPKSLFFVGDETLLKKPKISIVGSRRPNSYTKEFTYKLAKELSKIGICVVSGGAMGVDAIAHQGAYPNTIAILANSLEYFYPAVNEKLLSNIYQNSLALSEYEKDYKARPYSFVLRNRLVVGLSQALIITQADENSGSLRSAEFALKEGKKIYVLPHRLGESKGTQKLIEEKKAEIIYNFSTFISQFGTIIKSNNKDEILEYFQTNPSLDDALKKYGTKVYEYELDGKIEIKNLKVYIIWTYQKI